MLHILWLILKFILIILGILLGLLLLAVLLVLFCPVRYKASAVKAEGGWKQTEGEGIVSWLFQKRYLYPAQTETGKKSIKNQWLITRNQRIWRLRI